ncbi:MAG: histidine kinase [Bacteroidetes bacterium]|jgi:vacuolar-type H+-ATPase subunit I/STV1|nr:histidine kinase [Bacteroidota bacterium]
MSEDVYEEAKKRVKKKKDFHSDLMSYLTWSGIFLFINLFITRGYLWSLWVIGFWGIAILQKAISVYGTPFSSEDWEKKEIEKEMKRLRKNDFPKQKQKENEVSTDKKWDDDELV